MSEKKEVKMRLGTFVIITLAIGIVIALIIVTILCLILLNPIKEEIRLTSNSIFSEENEFIISEEDDSMTEKFVNEIEIDIEEIYGFACKSEIINEQYETEDTLVAINKNDGSETEIIEFNSGAYDYYDGKIYFYKETDNLYYGFYMIDLKEGIEPQEICVFKYSFPYLDELEYHNGKLYYTADGALFSLDLTSKDIEMVADIENYSFRINNKTDILYYTNKGYNLCEMNLKTKEIQIIPKGSVVRYLDEDKLIYQYEEGYGEYDLKNHTHEKIIESWGGTVGKTEITRYDGKFWYINKLGQLAIKKDNGEKQVLTEEAGYNALTILPNNKILLERNEAEDYGEDYKTYIYDIDTKQITPTDTNYRYSYMKKI